jgi:outer membrane protein assembly factor BamB
MKSTRFLLASIVLLCACLPTDAWAENWPQWRGPLGNGISSEKDVPTKWSKTENVAWRLPLPGPAGATPVVWGDRIFVSSADGKELVLLCISTDGKELWKRSVATGNNNVRDDEGNYASPTPVTDGRHVWVFYGEGTLACFNLDGGEVWKKNLQKDYGTFEIQFGMSSTPVLHGDNLYFQLIHGKWSSEPSRGHVVALDKVTGDEVWKKSRVTDAVNENKHSYASPILYDDGKLQFLVTHGADFVIAYDLKDGKEIWRCGNLNPKSNYNDTLRLVATPAAAPGLIVVPSAKGGPVLGLRADLMGDVTEQTDAAKWVMPRGTPDVPSPLIHDGFVYLCQESGNLICLDAQTGKQHYEARTVSERHRASPVYADGHIYLTARNTGTITVVRAGKQFEIVAKNVMGEGISASPVISGGRVYIRTFDALYAIGP